MKIHKEGHRFLSLTGLILLGLIVSVSFVTTFSVVVFTLLVAIIIFWFFMQFFRLPERTISKEGDSIVSPADGKVVVIEKVFESEYFKDERLQISIFMAPFDAHLNRIPLNGKLIYYKYHPGNYLLAFKPKSSELNERNTIVIKSPDAGTFMFRQIAGTVARRIKFYPEIGDNLKVGEELGFIKFGSRLDIFCPLEFKINVELDQRVYAGETIIGYPLEKNPVE